MSKRPIISKDEIRIDPNGTNKQLKKTVPPPIPPAFPVERPSSNWKPAEVNEVNKIDDRIEKGRKIGDKNAKLILGKLSPVKEKKGSQPSIYNLDMDETMKPIKCSVEQLKYPSKG